MIEPGAETSPVMKPERAPNVDAGLFYPASQQVGDDNAPFLSIALTMKHCIVCNRLTPYYFTFNNPYLSKMWLCWEHLSKKGKLELEWFYNEIGETYLEREIKNRL